MIKFLIETYPKNYANFACLDQPAHAQAAQTMHGSPFLILQIYCLSQMRMILTGFTSV